MLSSVSATSPAPAGEFVQWDDAFSAAELAAIEKYGDSLAPRKADLSDIRTGYDDIRITNVAWIKHAPETAWLYQRLEELVLRLNAEFFRYDLFGLSENFQYTVYDGSEGSHFDWHRDNGNVHVEPRKISLSLQLSDGSAYQGCDLELHSAGHIQTAPRTRGTLIAFPSYVLHRVTPIRSGVRKSLVVWAAGPEFQ
jgi:PKHD-type hydroxylase